VWYLVDGWWGIVWDCVGIRFRLCLNVAVVDTVLYDSYIIIFSSQLINSFLDHLYFLSG